LKINSFPAQITYWYHRHHRDLPWRHTRNPYFIWLSEVILQQTRVAQGMPYYLKFTEKYPTIFELARAPEQAVIRLWQGLGYYSRARNLHQTAQYIVENLGGEFPGNYQDLLKLKGIGPYTAAAIASFAYDEAVAVVDGNVYRVLARVFGVEADIASTEGKKQFAQLANKLLDKAQPASYNQAIMEFGALQCSPMRPNCLLCPLQQMCVAYTTGRVGGLPVKSKKTKVRERFFHYFVFEYQHTLAMRQRTDRDIWQQMYDFYLVEPHEHTANLNQLALEKPLRDVLEASVVLSVSKTYTHLLTHQRIKAQFWHVRLNDRSCVMLPPDLGFYTAQEIELLPKPVLVDSYLKDYFFDKK